MLTGQQGPRGQEGTGQVTAGLVVAQAGVVQQSRDNRDALDRLIVFGAHLVLLGSLRFGLCLDQLTPGVLCARAKMASVDEDEPSCRLRRPAATVVRIPVPG